MFKKNYLDELPDDIYKAIHKKVYDRVVGDIQSNTHFYEYLMEATQEGLDVNFGIFKCDEHDFDGYAGMKFYTEIMPYGLVDTIALPTYSYLLGGKKNIRRFNRRLKYILKRYVGFDELTYNIVINIRIKDEYIYIQFEDYFRCRAHLLLCINEAYNWIREGISGINEFHALLQEFDGEEEPKDVNNLFCVWNAFRGEKDLDQVSMQVFNGKDGCARTICECVF
jgi:hypothetical protein